MTQIGKQQKKGSWFRRLNFGTQLTLQLLPLVLIPALIMGLATYRRAYNLLREQAVSQMTVGSRLPTLTHGRKAGRTGSSFAPVREHSVTQLSLP